MLKTAYYNSHEYEPKSKNLYEDYSCQETEKQLMLLLVSHPCICIRMAKMIHKLKSIITQYWILKSSKRRMYYLQHDLTYITNMNIMLGKVSVLVSIMLQNFQYVWLCKIIELSHFETFEYSVLEDLKTIKK